MFLKEQGIRSIINRYNEKTVRNLKNELDIEYNIEECREIKKKY